MNPRYLGANVFAAGTALVVSACDGPDRQSLREKLIRPEVRHTEEVAAAKASADEIQIEKLQAALAGQSDGLRKIVQDVVALSATAKDRERQLATATAELRRLRELMKTVAEELASLKEQLAGGANTAGVVGRLDGLVRRISEERNRMPVGEAMTGSSAVDDATARAVAVVTKAGLESLSVTYPESRPLFESLGALLFKEDNTAEGRARVEELHRGVGGLEDRQHEALRQMLQGIPSSAWDAIQMSPEMRAELANLRGTMPPYKAGKPTPAEDTKVPRTQ